MEKELKECNFGKGARRFHPARLYVHKKLGRKKIGRAPIPFDWDKGYDVRDVVGEIEIKDQGMSSSCAGQSAAYFLEVQRRLRGIKEGAISAKSMYAPIAYPGGGSTVTALLTQLGSAGGNLEKSVPSYYLTGEPMVESDMTEMSWETPSVLKDALSRAGFTPFDLPEDMNAIASAIRDYGGAIWMIKGQDNGSWRSTNPVPPPKSSLLQRILGTQDQSTWNHFMFLCGAKMIDGKKTILALQSWGKNVGVNGEQRFTQEYFDAGGIIDAFTAVYNANIKPLDSNKSIWAEIWRWFNQSGIVKKKL